MSNPYNSQSAKNYNANPPNDDGEQTTDNQVTWAKHKSKLADPIKTLADGINSEVINAFDLVFGATAREVTSSQTIQTAWRGQIISANSANDITIELPSVSDAGEGFPLLLCNDGSSIVTIEGNGSELVLGQTSQALGPGMCLLVTCDGTKWFGSLMVSSSTGTFTTDWTGFSSAQSTTWEYTRTGRIVTMRPQAELSATSDSTLFVSDALDVPVAIRPKDTVNLPYIVRNNNTVQLGRIQITDTGLLVMGSEVSGAVFTASGNKGHLVQEVTYQLDN